MTPPDNTDGIDWDDAFSNMAHIPGSAAFPAQWAAKAAAFRAGTQGELDISYGPGPRHVLDLFRPASPARGLFVFVHGGYWMATDKSDWSHLAAGALARGYAAALPSYTLAPDARVSDIAVEISRAIAHAATLVPGPIVIAGHSAGGQLVTRLPSLAASGIDRLRRITAISGVYDLRPLRHTKMNDTLHLSAEEAAEESPLMRPEPKRVATTIWVGAEERPEFLRQARAMAAAWPGANLIEDPGRHHFDVLDGLESARSALMDACIGP